MATTSAPAAQPSTTSERSLSIAQRVRLGAQHPKPKPKPNPNSNPNHARSCARSSHPAPASAGSRCGWAPTSSAGGCGIGLVGDESASGSHVPRGTHACTAPCGQREALPARLPAHHAPLRLRNRSQLCTLHTCPATAAAWSPARWAVCMCCTGRPCAASLGEKAPVKATAPGAGGGDVGGEPTPATVAILASRLTCRSHAP
eukprot:scaffold69100_cov29-Phaeocystis_antarctica.AAC.2